MQAPSAEPRHTAATSSSVGPGHAVDRRRHLRLQGWDYTSPGWYFLTLCTQNMRSVFGTVVHGCMVLNASGTIADQCWREIPAHFPRAVLDEFVVMPNHLHGLLRLVGAAAGPDRALEAFGKPVAGSVPTILRSYKSAVTRALERGHGRAVSMTCGLAMRPPSRPFAPTSATTPGTSPR